MSETELFAPSATQAIELAQADAVTELTTEQAAMLEAEQVAPVVPDVLPGQMAFFELQEPWKKEWRGMPEFSQKDLSPFRTIYVHFENREDVTAFSKLIGQDFTPLTQSVWYPKQERVVAADKRWVTVLPAEETAGKSPDEVRVMTNPRYPIFIPTKGRWESRYTIKALEEIKVPYKAVVEIQELEQYVEAGVSIDNILVLPHQNQGLVVTRNWIWDYAQSLGVKRFWTMDDNISSFYRMTQNTIIRFADGMFLRVIEDFVDRYVNMPIAGMNYEMFAPRRQAIPPYVLNTRVYSNMLIDTVAKTPEGKPYRNEGFYNDDTDLCLRVLKAGFCTILFNAFLAKKIATMKVKGGMTPHYLPGQDGGEGKEADGRYRMAKELQEKHPTVTTITRKWGRWQHQVDYSDFKDNKLIHDQDAVIPEGINDYHMLLKLIEGEPDATVPGC